MMKVSIRRRLLFLLLSVICVVWSTVTWRVYVKTQHEVEELFDANLAQSARVLFGLLKHEALEEKEGEEDKGKVGIDFESCEQGHRYEHKLAFLIRHRDGRVLTHSVMAPVFPVPSRDSPHFSDYKIEEHRWRVFTLQEGEFFVQTGERYDIRNELIREIISSTLSVLLLVLPLFALLIWLSVGRSFKPLQQVATEIASRCPDQLQPLDIQKIPIEIIDIIDSLNILFTRLERAFENERRFTADAAHELRTPLAGLKTQAQVAQRATDPRQRQQALQQIVIGVDRATHLVTQLLILARMDATQTMSKQPLDLQALVSQILAELAPQALDKTIDLGLEEETTELALTIGNQDALSLLIRNLVDNAIRYTPAGGQVTVSLEQVKPSIVTLRVSDTGPGIPVEQRQRLFERFYRGDNHNIPGSGLGLSIAQRVAELHNIEISMDNISPGTGLSVSMDFVTTPA
jgi:two-component system sensor histidine kinase QseC